MTELQALTLTSRWILALFSLGTLAAIEIVLSWRE